MYFGMLYYYIMMTKIIFFNWNKLRQLPIKEIAKTLKTFPNNSILRRKYNGNSFIIFPEKVWLYNPTELEVAQMLQVASTRNYFNYWFNEFKGAYLDFSCLPQQRSSFKLNKLLRFDETNRFIYLKHEE